MHQIVRNSIRMYFAPLISAWKGVRTALLRINREGQRNRAMESRPEKD